MEVIVGRGLRPAEVPSLLLFAGESPMMVEAGTRVA
jgi:hypothetical protein